MLNEPHNSLGYMVIDFNNLLHVTDVSDHSFCVSESDCDFQVDGVHSDGSECHCTNSALVGHLMDVILCIVIAILF